MSWTTLELDISINGNVTHQSLNPGTSVQFKDADPGSTIVVSGTAKLSDGSTRPVQSDPVTIVKGNNNITLYCQYNYYLYGVSGFTNPGTYMSNQSISLPVVPDYTPAAGGTYPFAGWILNAPNLSVHGNYYPKGNSVPAKQVAGDIEFYPDYGFALYTEVSGGTKNYISAGAQQTLCSGGYLEIKGEDLNGTSVTVTPSSVSGSAVVIENVSGTLKVKGVAEGTATVTYTGTTKYGAPYSVNVPVKVEPVTLRIVDASNSVISTYQQTVGNAPTFKAELIHAAPVSMSSVTWTVSVPEDTSIGFAANDYSVANASDTLNYSGLLSNTDRSIYTKKDGTAVTGTTIPDTYSGTLTITAKYDAGSGEQTVSTTLQLTGYTLQTDLNVVLDTTNSNLTAATGGYVQSGTGTSSWLQVKLNKTSGIPAITATSGGSAVYDIQFAKKVSGTYSNPHSGTNYDTTNNGISINLLDTGGLNIQRTDSADVKVTCNVDYHGRQVSNTPIIVNLLAGPVPIKIDMGSSNSFDSNTNTWTVKQTASGGSIAIKILKESDSSNITKPSSGTPTLTLEFTDYVNDYGKTLDTTISGVLNISDGISAGATIGSAGPYTIIQKFNLMSGDSGTFKVTAKYTVNGVTEEATTNVKIVGCTPAAGMYYYKNSSGTACVSSSVPTAAGIKVLSVIMSVSGNSAKIIRKSILTEASAKLAKTQALTNDLPENTSSSNGLDATNSIISTLESAGKSLVNFPAIYDVKRDRSNDSIEWYIPAIDELTVLYSIKSTIENSLDSGFFNNSFWSSTWFNTDTDGSNTFKRYRYFNLSSNKSISNTPNDSRYVNTCFFANVTIPTN